MLVFFYFWFSNTLKKKKKNILKKKRNLCFFHATTHNMFLHFKKKSVFWKLPSLKKKKVSLNKNPRNMKIFFLTVIILAALLFAASVSFAVEIATDNDVIVEDPEQPSNVPDDFFGNGFDLNKLKEQSQKQKSEQQKLMDMLKAQGIDTSTMQFNNQGIDGLEALFQKQQQRDKKTKNKKKNTKKQKESSDL